MATSKVTRDAHELSAQFISPHRRTPCFKHWIIPNRWWGTRDVSTDGRRDCGNFPHEPPDDLEDLRLPSTAGLVVTSPIRRTFVV
jgi:hypothetical protein